MLVVFTAFYLIGFCIFGRGNIQRKFVTGSLRKTVLTVSAFLEERTGTPLFITVTTVKKTVDSFNISRGTNLVQFDKIIKHKLYHIMTSIRFIKT